MGQRRAVDVAPAVVHPIEVSALLEPDVRRRKRSRGPFTGRSRTPGLGSRRVRKLGEIAHAEIGAVRAEHACRPLAAPYCWHRGTHVWLLEWGCRGSSHTRWLAVCRRCGDRFQPWGSRADVSARRPRMPYSWTASASRLLRYLECRRLRENLRHASRRPRESTSEGARRARPRRLGLLLRAGLNGRRATRAGVALS